MIIAEKHSEKEIKTTWIRHLRTCGLTVMWTIHTHDHSVYCVMSCDTFCKNSMRVLQGALSRATFATLFRAMWASYNSSNIILLCVILGCISSSLRSLGKHFLARPSHPYHHLPIYLLFHYSLIERGSMAKWFEELNCNLDQASGSNPPPEFVT